MEEILLTNVYGNTADMSFTGLFLCVLTASVLGCALANLYYATSSTATKGFAMTLAIFPPITCVILLLISDNFGAGLAVAGIFALVKFKSITGNAKEIVALFISTGMGILCGTGYLAVSIFFSVVILLAFYAFSKLDIWNTKKENRYVRVLKIDASTREGARTELESFLGQYVTEMTLIAAENKAGKDKTEKSKSGKDKDKPGKEKAEKVLRYTYKITFPDDASERALLEALVTTNQGFEFGQYTPKKQDRL